jgi:DNA repair protein RadC
MDPKEPAKRINVVSIKMVKESSILYDIRRIQVPKDAVEIGKRFLEDSEREQLLVCCLDAKNQPTAVKVVSVGNLSNFTFYLLNHCKYIMFKLKLWDIIKV